MSSKNKPIVPVVNSVPVVVNPAVPVSVPVVNPAVPVDMLAFSYAAKSLDLATAIAVSLPGVPQVKQVARVGVNLTWMLPKSVASGDLTRYGVKYDHSKDADALSLYLLMMLA